MLKEQNDEQLRKGITEYRKENLGEPMHNMFRVIQDRLYQSEPACGWGGEIKVSAYVVL